MKKIILTITALASSIAFFGQEVHTQSQELRKNDLYFGVSSSSFNYGTTNSIGAKLGAWTDTNSPEYYGAAGIIFNRWTGTATNYSNAYVGQSRPEINSGWGLSFDVSIENAKESKPSTRMFINPYGNVGIGTTTPNYKLDVDGQIYSNEEVRVGNPNNLNASVSLNWHNDVARLRIGGTGEGALNGFEIQGPIDEVLMKVEQDGNVGIGTTTPNFKLDVDGVISTNSDLRAENPNNSGASVSLGWMDDIARLRVGGNGDGAGNGFEIQGVGDRVLLKLTHDSKVGIGTQNPDSELTVKGKIHCEEVQVDLQVPADYVFEKYYTGTSELKEDYTMPSLEEVEAYTKENHHLPNIPSAEEIKEEGLHLKEMTNLLLQKIEELTLYTIEQEKRIKVLEGKLTSGK